VSTLSYELLSHVYDRKTMKRLVWRVFRSGITAFKVTGTFKQVSPTEFLVKAVPEIMHLKVVNYTQNYTYEEEYIKNALNAMVE
jgi:hypothetical protein